LSQIIGTNPYVYYGRNLVVSQIRFTISSLNILSNSGIFPLTELFFINTVNSPYEGLYAKLQGDTFYGNVSIKRNLSAQTIEGSEDLNVTDSVDTTFLTSHNSFYYIGDVSTEGLICHSSQGELYCIEEEIWQEDNGDIHYLEGNVAIGSNEVSDASLVVNGELVVNNDSNTQIIINATESGDLIIESNTSGNVIFTLPFILPTTATCGDGVVQRPNDNNIWEECEFVNSQVFFPLGGSCSDYGYFGGSVSCNSSCQMNFSNCVSHIPDLVAYFPFSEESPLQDATGNGYDITTNTGATLISNGRADSAYMFDGVNDYLTFNRMISDDFTISLWMNTETQDTSSLDCDNWWGHPSFVFKFIIW